MQYMTVDQSGEERRSLETKMRNGPPRNSISSGRRSCAMNFLLRKLAMRKLIERHFLGTCPRILRKMLKKFTLSALVLAFAVPSYAQLSFGGQPYGDKAEKRGMPAAAAVHLPAVDVATLMQEDAARAAQGIKGPFRFGFEHLTDYTTRQQRQLVHHAERRSRLAAWPLHCPGALGINLQMSNFVIPEGGAVILVQR
jgi:hypothetical protein